jgi:SET domain-containing protein
MIHPALYFADTAYKGRGMFARDPIPANTVIEIAPVIIMSNEERKLLDQTKLHDYIFEWTPPGQSMCCMAQGYISLYNHSYSSNAEYFMDYEDATMQLITVRDIEEGEEVTINYNGDWNNTEIVWFDTHDD